MREAIIKLEYWRKNLCSEDGVKRQLADSYANADTEEEIKLLDEIWDLIYN